MEGQAGCEKDGKVRGGFVWGGGSGKEAWMKQDPWDTQGKAVV